MTKGPIVETQRGAIQAWTCTIEGWTTLADRETAERHVAKEHAPEKPIDKTGDRAIP